MVFSKNIYFFDEIFYTLFTKKIFLLQITRDWLFAASLFFTSCKQKRQTLRASQLCKSAVYVNYTPLFRLICIQFSASLKSFESIEDT